MDFSLIADATAAAEPSELMAWWFYIYGIFKVAVGLGFVIFVHELGHFLAAKWCGVKCEKFYVGFDIPMPKILGWRIPSKLFHYQWGETEYGIGILPLGGYVKMLGQDDDPRKFKAEQQRAMAAQHKEQEGENRTPSGDVPAEPTTDQPIYDPRSYQAKSVPQRMLIISAGVIMNLIFAVILGAAAYSLGVVYTPTVVGSAVPGGPAWTKDFRPGDKIVQIGRKSYRDESLRWTQDLIPKTVLNSGRSEMALLVRRNGEEEERWIELRPVIRGAQTMAMLGLQGPSIPVIGSTKSRLLDVPIGHFSAGKTDPALKPGDRIVAIDGETIAESDFPKLQQIFASKPDKTLTLTIERKVVKEGAKPDEPPAVTTFETKLAPQPRRTLGIVVKLGPIAAVRDDSPAKTTGFQVGDEIVAIDGQPVGDPLTLSQRLLPYVGQEIPVEIVRRSSDGKKQRSMTLRVTPEAPRMMDTGAEMTGGDLIGVETLGLAMPALHKVVDVEAGSPAEKAGLQPGDELVSVQFIPASASVREKMEGMKLGEQTFLQQIAFEQDKLNWVFLMELMQELPTDMKLLLTYRRGTQLESVKLETVEAKVGWFEPRGINFKGMSDVRTAQGVGEAFALGVRETKEKLMEVASVLGGLVTGRVPFSNLGGPISIARVAHMEATKGWASLMIFLTFLSANLALVNFLPIPVLDGGHMVFLIWEGIRGKPIDENLQGWALMVGLVFILGLMIVVFGLDIHRL